VTDTETTLLVLAIVLPVAGFAVGAAVGRGLVVDRLRGVCRQTRERVRGTGDSIAWRHSLDGLAVVEVIEAGTIGIPSRARLDPLTGRITAPSTPAGEPEAADGSSDAGGRERSDTGAWGV